MKSAIPDDPDLSVAILVQPSLALVSRFPRLVHWFLSSSSYDVVGYEVAIYAVRLATQPRHIRISFKC